MANTALLHDDTPPEFIPTRATGPFAYPWGNGDDSPMREIELTQMEMTFAEWCEGLDEATWEMARTEYIDLDPDLCLAMFRADVSPRIAATRALMFAGILTSAGALYVG